VNGHWERFGFIAQRQVHPQCCGSHRHSIGFPDFHRLRLHCERCRVIHVVTTVITAKPIGRWKRGHEKAAAEGADPKETKPKEKDQYNFTDPESRIMKGADGFVQAYNAQAAVRLLADSLSTMVSITSVPCTSAIALIFSA